jgi:replicative DNA helicase
MKLNKLLSQAPKKESAVISTGIASLDSMTGGGLHIGQVSTIAARPAMGKTAFAMSIVRNVGILNKVPTAILSLEHAEDYVVERLFATEFGFGERTTSLPQVTEEMENAVSLLQKDGFNPEEVTQEEFIQKMKEAPVWIEHGVNLTVDEVIARAERMKKNDNIQVLIIEGLAWIIVGQTYTEREQSMLKINQLASRLNIAILITSELTRDVEHRPGNKPMLSDLRGGFCAEVYSATVMFIYRPEYYGIQEDEYGSTQDVADIIVAKNDYGNVGEVRLKFANRARFEDMLGNSRVLCQSQIEDELAAVTESLDF